MNLILTNEADETKKKFMDGRLASGQLYFLRLETDIHGDSYLIIKKT